MFIKRQLPVVIMIGIGLLTLSANFLKLESINSWVKVDSLLWFDIIAAFAILLGAFHLLKIHFSKIDTKHKDYPYSIILIIGFLSMIFAGFLYRGGGEQVPWGEHLNSEGSLFKWIFDSIFAPLEATMFALLAFFVASASYRAFRIRNFEASLLLTAGIFVMLGAVPIGNYIPSWLFAFIFWALLFALISPLFKDKNLLLACAGISFCLLGITMYIYPLDFLTSKSIMLWILGYPTRAGKTAILMGIALGIVGTSLRIIFGKDKSFLGD